MVDLEAQEECLLEARIAAWLESLPVELIDRVFQLVVQRKEMMR